MTFVDKKVKVTVVESLCPKYSVGDELFFEGSMLNKEKSANVCMVALNAIYPFIYAFRRGGSLKKGPYQCTDCAERVIFEIEAID